MTQPSATQPSKRALASSEPISACLHGLGQRLRDLQRARHGDALVGGPRGLQLGDGAGRQLLGDGLVVGRLDDEDVRALAAARPARRWPRPIAVPCRPWPSADPALADDAQAERLEADIARRRRVGEQHHVADAQRRAGSASRCRSRPAAARPSTFLLGRLLSAFCATHADTDLGRKSRISTITPRPSSAIIRMAFSISEPSRGPRRRRPAGRSAR